MDLIVDLKEGMDSVEISEEFSSFGKWEITNKTEYLQIAYENNGIALKAYHAMHNYKFPVRSFTRVGSKFSEHLSDSFEQVITYSTQQRKVANEFMQLMKDRATVEMLYARDLDKVWSRQLLACPGTLNSALLGLNNEFSARGAQAKALVENFNVDILAPLAEVISNQSTAFKKLTAKGRRLDKELANLTTQHERARCRYLKACQEAETLSDTLEAIFDQTSENRARLIKKVCLAKNEMEAAQKAYHTSVTSLNNCKIKFKKEMAEALDELQEQEKERQECIRDWCRKYVVFQTAGLRSQQYDVESVAQVMESVEIQSDIEAYIGLNAQGPGLSGPVEFEPFQSTSESFAKLLVEAPIAQPKSNGWMSTMKGMIKSVIPLVDEAQKEAELAQLWKTAMNDIMESTWQGTLPEMEHYSRFNIMIKEKAGRVLWKNFLDNKRIASELYLSPSAFELQGNLLLGVLNECEASQDANILKSAILLSQKFYQQPGEDEPKEYLTTRLSTHQIWQSMQIWEKIIELSIADEIDNYTSVGIDINDAEEGARVKNLVFWQLGNYAFLLQEFGLEKLPAGEIISKYACKYDLTKGDMETLMANIDRYEDQGQIVTEESDVISSLVSPRKGEPEWIEDMNRFSLHPTSPKLEE